jgi:hypothetical protein
VYRLAERDRNAAAITSEEIEQGFASAGWEIDDGFSGHLVIGSSGDNLSILFYREMRRADDPVFEILDHVRNVTYWVREIPTPRQAGELLEEHGGPPEEERGNPHRRGNE